MQLVTRSEWGAKSPKSVTKLAGKNVRGMAIHYSGGAGERKVDHNSCPKIVRGIQAYHMVTQKWTDIAYNFLVCWHGWVFEGRGWDVRSAANGTNYGNDRWFAVCFLGGDVEGRDDVTDVGRRAIWEVAQACAKRYNGAADHRPHSSFKATACPGNELRIWIEAGLPVDVPPPPTGVIMVNAPVVAVMTHEAWEGGYIQVGADGGIFHHGCPQWVVDMGGSLAGQPLAAPIIDADVSPTGRGFILSAEDGGIFTVGDAVFHGRVEYRR
jgi:hypothetical protein